ncbi:disease resistance protein RGA2-like [Lolium rigidum]|uniref:disease resistance protein RGA2-like n=1 Tax=Lolium rigidum TaxID=89674 RepID=UPI001F5C200C|nr:disease resistance protein RGA2-like [Lolium rigidum]XP_047062744.1 disease resistance protein RGA2-like [Lolium rigidum]
METAGISATTWVVGKALSPLSGGLLEAWGASSLLGSNMEDLKMQLMYAQAMLNNVQGREIHNPALGELLGKLRQLAYGADDLLDELDYFRIQDELDGTYHAADAHAAGCVPDLVLNARHTVRSFVNKVKLPACSRAATRDHPDEQQDGVKQGCFSRICSCGRCDIFSLPPSPASQVGLQVDKGCVPKFASSARDAALTVGKHFPCYSFPSVHDDDSDTSVRVQRFVCGAWKSSKASQRNHDAQAPRLKFDRVEMSKKIRNIVEQLKPVCAMVSTILNLELLGSSRTPSKETAMNRAQTTPKIVEPKLYGRDSQKNFVENEIVNDEYCALTVLPVVGPGGIGKTTFMQHIYEEMKSHFQVPIWVCVSLDFNANRLAKDIVKKIPKVDNENTNSSDEELIEQRIKGKRVLLVLDDVWTHHDNEWTKLLALFKKEGAKGNMVIVTTRIPEVANKVKTTKCSLELERLSPKDIMNFFEECVFGVQKPWVDHPELAEVGREIVEKLKGSPLAAKTVGRLLRNKLTLNHWISILESKEWESQTNDNDIMPALKLSYDYLPFHLQKCFSYCALFPEDYEFGREELVQLWIGLDILHSCDMNKKRIEDVGLFFLNELVNHGFFKITNNQDGRPFYVIHDLLHELAVHVSSSECLSIYSSNVKDIQTLPTVRHLSIIVDSTYVKNRLSFKDYNDNLSALGKRLKVENLHTLMLFGDYHGNFAKTFGGLFREAKAIRVIFLSGVSYDVDDIFYNFAKLVHLRYLRIKPLSHWILSLPSVLFRLYHLEVIDLSNANRCVISTRHMGNLVKMRHFLVQEDQFNIHSNIFGVGKLKLFQELREFRVRKQSEGFEPSQLGQLTELGGSLCIYNLEKVKTTEEANELKLIHKKHLRELILEWDPEPSNNNPLQEEIILESLVPHSSLQELRIKGHGGTNCPSWLCDNLSVKCLESVCLEGVSWKNLPPLGEIWMVNERGEEYQCCSISPPNFHNLKRLQLSNISSLSKWVGNGASPFFSHLEVLILTHCFELMELPFSHPTCCQAQQEEKMAWFPKLQELVIEDCPKLASLPPIPWRIHAPCSAMIESVGSDFEKLLYKRIDGKEVGVEVEGKHGHRDVSWNVLNFSNLADVEYLRMARCPLMPLNHMRVLTSLKKIEIVGCPSSILSWVQGVGHGIYRFPCEDFTIRECDTSGEELTLLLSFFPELSTLRIYNCKNITGLGVAENAKTTTEEQQQTRDDNKEIITTAIAASQGLLLLPPKIQFLLITECFSNPPNDDHAGGGGLQRLSALRQLDIENCPEFFSSISSSSFPPFPTCLQVLMIKGVKHMETLHAISNLTSLTALHIKLIGESRAEGLWPLLAHGSLTECTALHLPVASGFFADPDPSRPHDIEVFSRSSKLLYLTTGSNTGVLAASICSLLSSTLTRLHLIFHDDEVERLTKDQEEALQLLTSLQEIGFFKGDKLQRLPAGIHELINLKKLDIWYCSAIPSLPSLPSSLRELEIYRCDSLKSLPNSLPSSLEILEIAHCHAIKSLPKDGLPRSMLELDVHRGNSEELKRACRKLIGTIPVVRT